MSDPPGGGDGGRYLYCVVSLPDGESVSFPDVEGVEGGQPEVVAASGLGAVVQPCERQFDSGDPESVREWLLRHQGVVDRAGEAFGTPLPFRFGTVLSGGDDGVRSWLAGEADGFADALADLAGAWEYRVELSWDLDAVADGVEGDEQLAELRERKAAASEGEAFLVGKQLDARREELAAERRAATVSSLRDRLAEHARAVRSVDRSASVLDDRDPGTRDATAVLAPESAEADVGAVLDEVAETPGVEVRFTGPWPPYSFAPAGGETE